MKKFRFSESKKFFFRVEICAHVEWKVEQGGFVWGVCWWFRAWKWIQWGLWGRKQRQTSDSWLRKCVNIKELEELFVARHGMFESGRGKLSGKVWNLCGNLKLKFLKFFNQNSSNFLFITQHSWTFSFLFQFFNDFLP